MIMYAIRLVNSYELKYHTFIGVFSNCDYWSRDVKDASLYLSRKSAEMNLSYLLDKFPDAKYEIIQVEIDE